MDNSPSEIRRWRSGWPFVLLLFVSLGTIFLLFRRHLFGGPIHAIRRQQGRWTEDTGAYAGSDSCRPCHAGIAERQLASNHARTVRDLSLQSPLAPFTGSQPVIDPLTGAQYTMEKDPSHRPMIVLKLGSQEIHQQLAFEFGSGVHAFGYLGSLGQGDWIDARLNYYSAINAWDFTSSQDKPNAYLTQQPLGRPQTEALAGECFACHSTVVRVEGSGVQPDGKKVWLRPDRSDLGVTCEACHGPRADHVRAKRSGTPAVAATPQSADEINQVCGKCHGLTGVNPNHPVIARFQPWGLERSTCFRRSQGRLTCLTCHDPHENAVRTTAYYEAKCLGCHASPAQVSPGVSHFLSGTSITARICPKNTRTGCVKCHMPEDSHSMLHMTFSDHRIRIVTQ